MKIKVPFKFWGVIFEKEVDFLFRIATLESASLDILKCELDELQEQETSKMDIAVLYSAYVLACEKNRKRILYSYDDAKYWAEHMSKTSHDKLIKAMQDLIGKMAKMNEEKKKK